jgi:hypothetical protein
MLFLYRWDIRKLSAAMMRVHTLYSHQESTVYALPPPQPVGMVGSRVWQPLLAAASETAAVLYMLAAAASLCYRQPPIIHCTVHKHYSGKKNTNEEQQEETYIGLLNASLLLYWSISTSMHEVAICTSITCIKGTAPNITRAAAPAAVPILKPCYWLSDMQVIFVSFCSIYVRTAQVSGIDYIVESVGGDVRPPSVALEQLACMSV